MLHDLQTGISRRLSEVDICELAEAVSSALLPVLLPHLGLVEVQIEVVMDLLQPHLDLPDPFTQSGRPVLDRAEQIRGRMLQAAVAE